jgi:hypothetical protein
MIRNDPGMRSEWRFPFPLANRFRSIIQRGFLSQFQPLKLYAVAPDLCKVVLRLLHKPGKTLEMSRALRAAAVLLLTAIPTSAHHAFAAEYDANKLVTISGIVAKFEWTNPHAAVPRRKDFGKAAHLTNPGSATIGHQSA